MRKECKSQPAGLGTLQDAWWSLIERERDSGAQKTGQTVLHGSGQLLVLLELTLKNLTSSNILALWYEVI